MKNISNYCYLFLTNYQKVFKIIRRLIEIKFFFSKYVYRQINSNTVSMYRIKNEPRKFKILKKNFVIVNNIFRRKNL